MTVISKCCGTLLEDKINLGDPDLKTVKSNPDFNSIDAFCAQTALAPGPQGGSSRHPIQGRMTEQIVF